VSAGGRIHGILMNYFHLISHHRRRQQQLQHAAVMVLVA